MFGKHSFSEEIILNEVGPRGSPTNNFTPLQEKIGSDRRDDQSNMIGSSAFTCLSIHKMSLARISLVGEQKGNIQLEALARIDSCIWIPDFGIEVF